MKQRVLVIDDDELTLEILRTILDLEEFAVQTASDGESALESIESGDLPDVVVCDVMMPGIDGFEVCRRLKSADRTKHLPVVLLTARDLDEDRQSGYDAGCDAYLTKPFSPLELIGELTSLGLGSSTTPAGG